MNFDLKGKLGPLPVWAWGVIVGLVLVAGVFIYGRRNQSDGSAAIQGTAIDPQGYQTAGITGGSAQATDTATQTGDYRSNASWLADAAADVAQFTGGSPTAIYAALQKFIYGETLSSQERKYVDTAVSRTGTPPEGTYGISSTQVRSLGYAAVPTGTGQFHRFEIYDDGSRRFLSNDEIVRAGIGKGDRLPQYTLEDLKSKFPTGRSDDPA